MAIMNSIGIAGAALDTGNFDVVRADPNTGKAQPGLKVGTVVQTNGGNYIITQVNPDGSYESQKIPNSSTSTYSSTSPISSTTQSGLIGGKYSRVSSNTEVLSFATTPNSSNTENAFKQMANELSAASSVLNKINNTSSNNITIGDIHLHDVQNTDQLSHAIVRDLGVKLSQKLNQR